MPVARRNPYAPAAPVRSVTPATMPAPRPTPTGTVDGLLRVVMGLPAAPSGPRPVAPLAPAPGWVPNLTAKPDAVVPSVPAAAVTGGVPPAVAAVTPSTQTAGVKVPPPKRSSVLLG